jgi:hypothetical protein
MTASAAKENNNAIRSVDDPRIVLIDTNCFIRLYQSPVLPFFGEVVDGGKLLTLTTLIDEFFSSPRLKQVYAWLQSTVNGEDRDKIELSLSVVEQASVGAIMQEHRDYVDDVLDGYCVEQGRQISKRLSDCDLQLLATAIEVKALIATDEWPLAVVVDDLMLEPEEGYQIGILTSIDIIYMLEKVGKLSREDRIGTIKSWLRNDEKLPRDWRRKYRELFNDVAPTL